ncbi:MAG: hypothetical protein EB084_10370 [Proteobacteria bacterium]|nr:hypothetical protein [Pseudomonadota bacterium]
MTVPPIPKSVPSPLQRVSTSDPIGANTASRLSAVMPHDVSPALGSHGERKSDGVSRVLLDAFCPTEVYRTTTPDYVPSRRWAFAEHVAAGTAAFASGAAMAGVLGIDPVWGGEAMATFDMLREQAKESTAIFASRLSPMAERNPRAWLLAGTIARETGRVVESMSAVCPDALLPLALTGSVLVGAGKSVDTAVSAGIDVRQAKTDNLAEVCAKNSNQTMVAKTAGGLLGLGIHAAFGAALGAGFGPALCASAATAAVLASARSVSALNEHPVNEDALRRITDALDRGRRMPGPDAGHVWRELTTLTHNQRYVVGQSIAPLLKSPDWFEKIRSIHEGRAYLLDLQKGEPYIVMREGATASDRLQAVLQAVYVERLKKTPAFARMQGTKAQEWLLEESAHRSAGDMSVLIDEMASAGWNADKLRFADKGVRAVW